MRFLTFALLALPAASSSAAPPSRPAATPTIEAGKPTCVRSDFEVAGTDASQPVKPRLQQLGELPSGALVLTVLREENGCLKPVVVRYGYGAGASSTSVRSSGGEAGR